jgi:cysteinyl-tRNA synthetase
MCGTLGLTAEGYLERKQERWLKKGMMARAEIEDLIALRDRARSEKNWSEADRIRNELNQKGIAIEDTPKGTLWKVK